MRFVLECALYCEDIMYDIFYDTKNIHIRFRYCSTYVLPVHKYPAPWVIRGVFIELLLRHLTFIKQPLACTDS